MNHLKQVLLRILIVLSLATLLRILLLLLLGLALLLLLSMLLILCILFLSYPFYILFLHTHSSSSPPSPHADTPPVASDSSPALLDTSFSRPSDPSPPPSDSFPFDSSPALLDTSLSRPSDHSPSPSDSSLSDSSPAPLDASLSRPSDPSPSPSDPSPPHSYSVLSSSHSSSSFPIPHSTSPTDPPPSLSDSFQSRSSASLPSSFPSPSASDPSPLSSSTTRSTQSSISMESTSIDRNGPHLRPLVLDGSNIAMAYGRGQIFECRALQMAYDELLHLGYQEILVIVPQWRRNNPPRQDKPINDQHIMEKMHKKGILEFSPARRVGGKNYACYDDRFILRLAYEFNGAVISNDNYTDLFTKNPDWRDLIRERVFGFMFGWGKFMLPYDPMGRWGPTLDQLSFLPPNSSRSHPTMKNAVATYRGELCPSQTKTAQQFRNRRKQKSRNI